MAKETNNKVNDVALRIKLLRTEFGFTQEAVAKQLGITQQTYSKYEKGTPIDNNIIIKLCELYGVTADYLLGLNKTKKVDQNTESTSYENQKSDIIDLIASRVIEKMKGDK